MKNVVGKPVQGNDFFGRGLELQELQRIAEDEHVLLLAPRRVGKTSLLFALQRACNLNGSVAAAYATVAAAKTEREFVRTVLGAIYATPEGKRFAPGRVGAWFQRTGRRVKSAQVAGSGVELESSTDGWQEDAERAVRPLLAARRPWLILIDELPTLVLDLARHDATGDRVRTFLQWLRNLRQLPGANRLRFILAGSIGLDSVTRRFQLTHTINDLRDWRLGPYSAATADLFLSELAASYGMDLQPSVRDRICELAEWLIPYHLQVIFSALREGAGGTKPTVVALDAVVERLLTRKVYFHYWDERLGGALGAPDDQHARLVLGACARDPDGVTMATLQRALAPTVADAPLRARTLDWILDVLANDGYLVSAGRRWRFRSGLLRRYWRAHIR